MAKNSVASTIVLGPGAISDITVRLPANIAVLVKGPTGVGKSFLANEVATRLGMTLIDVRGSTMDEAGVTGIPDFEGSKTAGVSYFLATSWFKRACEEPVVLFLDELNRAMPQVMQSFFQIVLDRELGNDVTGAPRRLHPETRVWAAINAGNEYDVNEMDPALLRRFWVVELETGATEWINWAANVGVAQTIIDFIKTNPNELRVDPGSVAPGTVCPNPASWHRLDQSLKHMGWDPDQYIGGQVPPNFYATAAGFVGSPATSKFVDHIRTMKSDVSALDILERFDKVKPRMDNSDAAQMNKVLDKLAAHFRAGNLLTKLQQPNLIAFCDWAGGEIMFRLWTEVSRCNDVNIIRSLHNAIGKKTAILAANATAVATGK